MLNEIYIEAVETKNDDKNYYLINLESYIILNIYQVCKNNEIKLKIRLTNKNLVDFNIKIDLSKIIYEFIDDLPLKLVSYCKWPLIVIENNYIIAGLCSVAREIIRNTNNDEKIRKLLGFREACLMACSESSIWTKFCEIDMITTIKTFMKQPEDYFVNNTLTLPTDVTRFEYHLSQPVRIHNIYKVARETAKNKEINSKIPIDELNLEHTFSEGPFITLADLILFLSLQIFFQYCPLNFLSNKIPLINNWFNNVQQSISITKLFILSNQQSTIINEVIEGEIIKQSLYTADPSRYKPEKRIYTKQKDIINSLQLIHQNDFIDVHNNFTPYGDDITSFNWSNIPLEANPLNGALPEKRSKRKCDQLENLAKAVIKLVEMTKLNYIKIVDFCSGSGHLGILLAYLLPNCEIILIENKEQSLKRAIKRTEKLNLNNVCLLQTNLDYFIGHYTIGVSLHACGVATDLVIENCIKNQAHFVCCPCCYGGIHDCYHLTYPRSLNYKKCNVNYKDYLILAHAADQTHDQNNLKTNQGYVCMDIIDTDRKLYAESYSYDVHLGKLQPTNCTNKNNLLVGMFHQ